MITVREVEEIHNLLIDTFGGSYGTRDFSGLDSALARPFQTFGKNDLTLVQLGYCFVALQSRMNLKCTRRIL